MGRRRKHHHSSDIESIDESETNEPTPSSLKLVLKLGDVNKDTEIVHAEEKIIRKRGRKRKIQNVSENECSTEHNGCISTNDDTDLHQSPQKNFIVNGVSISNSSTRPHRERKDARKANLRTALDHVHRQLIKKDVKNHFSIPVTDAIAPGYSDIVSCPMDLATIGEKIVTDQYYNFNDYKIDVKLIFDNAMLYNGPDTIYYKEAKKLWSSAEKLLSDDKLLSLRKELPCMMALSLSELGLEDEENESNNLSMDPVNISPISDIDKNNSTQTIANEILNNKDTSNSLIKEIIKPLKTNEKKIEIEKVIEVLSLDKQNILTDVKENIVEKKTHHSSPKIEFLRKKNDGTTSLCFLNPDNSGYIDEKKRVITLGQIAGKIQEGSGEILQFSNNNHRDIAKSVQFINYGPYCSFGPSYDSTFATLNIEDSKTLLNTYGEDNQCHLSEEFESIDIELVNSMLEFISGCKDKDLIEKAQELKLEAEKLQNELASNVIENECVEISDNTMLDIDFTSLKTLSNDLNIDTTFLESYEKEYSVENSLQRTKNMIIKLEGEQIERLSKKPPLHLKNISLPGEEEKQLAMDVTSNLANIMKQFNPGQLISINAIRKAIGIEESV